MSMSKLVAMLGSAASGYNAGLNAKEERDDRARRRQQEQEDRAFTMAERARATKMRDDMGAAAAPVAVEQVQPAGPVMDGAEGAAGQAIPQVYTVQGKSFASPDEATAAAAAQNTPQAITNRMADVAMRNGDPVKAQQLRVGSMQEQTGQFQLNAAMRADLDAKFNDELQKNVTDWSSFDKFTSESAGDGMGGAVKLKTLPSADGKTMVVNVIGPDGVLTPTSKVFPNTADGLAMATAELSRMPAEKKLAHLHQKAMLEQQAKRDANTAAYQEGLLATKFDKNDIDAMKGSAKSAIAKMPEEDKAVLLDLNKQLELINSERVKAQAGGMWQADSPGALAIQKQEATLMLRRSMLLKRYQADQPVADPLNLRGGQGGGQGNSPAPDAQPARRPTMIDAVGEAMKRNGDGPNVRIELKNPNAPYAKTKAQADSENAGLVKTTAKTGSSGPTMLDTAAGAVRDYLKRNAETGRQMEAIRARVREADDGGKPLTAAERATARQFGLAPRN